MKSILNQKLYYKTSRASNLKLVVSISRSISDLGVNEDLYTFGKMLTYNVNFSFYDKKRSSYFGKAKWKNNLQY